MENALTNTSAQLPTTIPELSRFVLVGRDKLQAVKAEIHAIEKVGLAQEVREQKLQEAQEIAEVVTDAEVRIGELLKQIPKASGGDRKSDSFKNSPHVDFDSQKPKSQVIKENGLTQRQAEHFRIMADNPDSVAKAKEKARKDGEVLSRSAVLKQVVSDCPKKKTSRQIESEAKERHAEFKAKKENGATVIDLQEVKEDARDVRIIGRSFCIEIMEAAKKLQNIMLTRNREDMDALLKTYPWEDRKRLLEIIDDTIRRLNFIRKELKEIK